MQLSTRTDYAIRVLLFLSGRREMVPTHVIASSLGVSEGYLPKTLRFMREAGWVASEGGTTGGYTMLVEAESLTLWDVMEVMEDSMYCNRCLESDEYCKRAKVSCPMRRLYEAYQQISEDFWKSVTIADIRRTGGVAEFLRAFPYSFSPKVMEEIGDFTEEE